ncbi:MAG: subclass B3 metallo-beta-lactamase [Nevskia sp.]|nr:subclass B3 metallo-beta-lactamase [Nevskia sp.]
MKPAVLLCLCLAANAGVAAAAPDPLTQPPPVACKLCAEWNQPAAPFRLYGNTYYVGMHGLSSVLVATSDGLVLLDGGLPQSAPLIESNIRALGFKLRDVKLILNSHTHFDHAGGIAALQRDSGAMAMASPSGAQALRQGHAVADDPQAGYTGDTFPPVPKVRTVRDGETLVLGEVSITAHFTPGHTPGSTTWTWQSCEGQRCLNMVYADSLTAVAAPGFRYLGDKDHPDVSGQFRASIDRVAALPCDVLVTVHPDVSRLWERLDAHHKGATPDPLFDAGACRRYADDARRGLEERLAQERAGTAK